MIITRDEAFRVVCNFRTPIVGHPDQITVGTGIFMTKDNRGWIVTASHVAKGTNTNTKIAICNDSFDCVELRLADLNPTITWQHHAVADISVLPIWFTPSNEKYMQGRCLPYDHFNLDVNAVSRDAELTAVGFPNGLGVEGKFCPLTFRSYASSGLLTLPRADTHTPSDFFCLENPSVGGYSGCPVFDLGYMIVGAMTTTKEKTICYGIMHGTMSDNTGGKIAMVTPTYYLKDLIG